MTTLTLTPSFMKTNPPQQMTDSENQSFQDFLGGQMEKESLEAKETDFQKFISPNMGLIFQAANFFSFKLRKPIDECVQEALILAWRCWLKWIPGKTEFSTYFGASWRKKWISHYRKKTSKKEMALWSQFPVDKNSGETMQFPIIQDKESNVNGELVYKHLNILTPAQRAEVDRFLGKPNPILEQEKSRACKSILLAKAKRILRKCLKEKEVFL